MRKSTWTFLLVAALVVQAAPVRAQADVLAAIPDDVMGFGVISNLGKANEKIAAIAKRMNLPLPLDPLTLAKIALGVDKGLAVDGSVAIALYPGKGGIDDEPRALIFIPVSDYKAFIAPFQPGEEKAGISDVKMKDGKNLVVGKRGKFAVLTEAQHREVLAGALASTKSLTIAAAPITAWLSENDVAGVLTARGLKMVSTKALQGLAEGKQNLGGVPAEMQAFVGKFFDSIEGCIKSIESDVSHFGLGMRFDADGNAHVNLRAQFVKDSSFAKLGGKVMASPGGPLAGLPAGPFVLALGGAVPKDAMEALTKMNAEILKATGQNIPEETLKKLDAANAKMMNGISGMGIVWQVAKDNQPLLASIATVMRTNDAKGYMAEYEKNLAVQNELLKGLNLPFMPNYDVKKVKVGGKQALEMSMDFGGLGLPEEALGIMKKVFGPDGKMTVSAAARDDKTVVMRYAGAESLKNVLSGGDKGLTSETSVVQAAKLLPTGSQWAFYLSPQGATQFADQAIKLSPFPINIPEFPATPPIAVGAKVSGESFELHIVVPGAVLEHAPAFIEKMKAAFGGA